MPKQLVVALGLFLLASVLWVQDCSGPEPTVADVQLLPPGEDGNPYRIRAVVRNTGPGHGQVNVLFKLTDKSTGVAFAEEQKTEIDRYESLVVVAEILAPLAEYEPKVEANYPPL